MKKVILVSYDKVTKEFQYVETITAVCEDVQSAGHFITLTEDRLHNMGYRMNNIKMKNTNIFSNNI